MWQRDYPGWIHQEGNTPWHEKALHTGLRGILYRLLHRCTPTAVGVWGWNVTERCHCGAVRFGATDVMSHMWSGDEIHAPDGRPPGTPLPDGQKPQPASASLHWQIHGGWCERNSRYLDTAMLYQPHLRPLKGTAR